MFQPEHFEKCMQDLEPAFHCPAQFYWGHGAALLSAQRLSLEASVLILLPGIVSTISTDPKTGN
jgi:hypothetical protein